MSRIKKPVEVIYDRECSDVSGRHWTFTFTDIDGIEYEWNTITTPEEFYTGEIWLVSMTVISEHEVLGKKYFRVKNLRLLEKLN